jgi:hypothetical protein
VDIAEGQWILVIGRGTASSIRMVSKAIKALSDRAIHCSIIRTNRTQRIDNIPYTAIMKFITALLASLATLSAANPLPVDSAVIKALAARADIVSVTCPAVANAGASTYSTGNIDEAYTVGSGVLRPPPHLITGSNGIPSCYTFITRGSNTDADSR